jgi:endo-1,3(4)-beta-glucanase
MSFVYSAMEFSSQNMDLAITDTDTFSVTASLSAGGTGRIKFPMALGMGFVTAEYNNLTPHFFSQLGFSSVQQSNSLSVSGNTIQKYILDQFNGPSWVMYVTVPSGQTFDLQVISPNEIKTSQPVTGVVVQVGIVPSGAEANFDSAAGMYPVGASVDASVTNDVATYSITYNTKGASSGGTTWIWALPHHVASFSSSIASTMTSFTIDSTTKGIMTGCLTNVLEMVEQLNPQVQFLPWSTNLTPLKYTQQKLQVMASIANSESAQDVSGETNNISTYWAGKAFDKFAYILLVVQDILQNNAMASVNLASLKSAIVLFTSNTQQTPLMYDTTFMGITSSAANQPGGSPNDDYGSPYYNDHHYHYGYFIHAAAVIGHVDAAFGGNWIAENRDWVNSLVRDVANPSKSDGYFPVYRMFDFFNGHSWAAGLFESADGKNEESTSEDYNFAYGMKLWGKVTGDQAMEARGDLMLSIMKRSMGTYFYMLDDNTVQPSNFIANKVAGITFENKCDHTTFFGTNLEFIQGIHMIPITPASILIRTQEFVHQEWTELLASIVGSLDSGWAGILRSNQALIDPTTAFEWFSQSNFQSEWLDSGASQTWYLALSAGLMSFL